MQSAVSPHTLLKFYEDQFALTQDELKNIRSMLKVIRKAIHNGASIDLSSKTISIANLKWRKEIRDCLSYGETQFYIATSTDIAGCVAYKNKLEVDRNILTKISSTLSLMHKESEIGRVLIKNSREYFYGLKDFFNDDGASIKERYKKNFNRFLTERSEMRGALNDKTTRKRVASS